MKLDHIMEDGLYRWSQVTHGQHQTHLVSCPDLTMYASQWENKNWSAEQSVEFLGPSTECDKDQWECEIIYYTALPVQQKTFASPLVYPGSFQQLCHKICWTLLWYTTRIAENFRRRKLSQISQFCGESFNCKIWGVASFAATKVSNPWKFSPRKSYFHQFAKVFSLESFPVYGCLLGCMLC